MVVALRHILVLNTIKKSTFIVLFDQVVSGSVILEHGVISISCKV